MAWIAVQQDGANAGGCSVKILLRVQCKSQQLPISINHLQEDADVAETEESVWREYPELEM